MSGWRVFISGAISATGVVAFLTLVAHEIEQTERDLDRWEERERKACRKRQMDAAADARQPKEDAA